MKLKNITLGRIERLAMLGCPIVIKAGAAHVSLRDLAASAVTSLLFRARIRYLRAFWKSNRRIDRACKFNGNAFWETYVCTRYEARQVLPVRRSYLA
ncbi:MAG: hypothetical protein ACRCUB_15530 [Plesiomonas shigelloides]